MANWMEQREELGRILGLDGPAPDEVLRAAIENPTYANNLLLCRRDPQLLQQLLARPPPRKNAFTTVELVSRGASALVRWAATGFATVDDATLARRVAACGACPHLMVPPGGQRVLYRLVGVERDERVVCGLCGCAVSRKVHPTSESCPGADPDHPGLSRWGDPLPSPRQGPEGHAREHDAEPGAMRAAQKEPVSQ